MEATPNTITRQPNGSTAQMDLRDAQREAESLWLRVRSLTHDHPALLRDPAHADTARRLRVACADTAAMLHELV